MLAFFFWECSFDSILRRLLYHQSFGIGTLLSTDDYRRLIYLAFCFISNWDINSSISSSLLEYCTWGFCKRRRFHSSDTCEVKFLGTFVLLRVEIRCCLSSLFLSFVRLVDSPKGENSCHIYMIDEWWLCMVKLGVWVSESPSRRY
jgi:hypothetical protein